MLWPSAGGRFSPAWSAAKARLPYAFHGRSYRAPHGAHSSCVPSPPRRPGPEQPIGSSSIFVKFCASCQHHGLWVPVERVRVLPPTVRLDNTASNGVWSTAHTGRLPPYRICNQTRRCTGPRFVIFREPPTSNAPVSVALGLGGGVMGWPFAAVSAELIAAAELTSTADVPILTSTADVPIQGGSQTWDEIPEQWATSRNEHGAVSLHMHLAHGTLVPQDTSQRRKARCRSAREPAPSAAASSSQSMPPPAVSVFSAVLPPQLGADPREESVDLSFLDSVLSEEAEGGTTLPSPAPSPPEPPQQVQLLTERMPAAGEGLWAGWNGLYAVAVLVAALAGFYDERLLQQKQRNSPTLKGGMTRQAAVALFGVLVLYANDLTAAPIAKLLLGAMFLAGVAPFVLGHRLAARIVCSMFVAFPLVATAAVVLRPSAVLAANTEALCRSASSAAIVAACPGVWLGFVPTEHISTRTKLATVAATAVLMLCHTGVLLARLGDSRCLRLLFGPWILSFPAAFFAAQIGIIRVRHRRALLQRSERRDSGEDLRC